MRPVVQKKHITFTRTCLQNMDTVDEYSVVEVEEEHQCSLKGSLMDKNCDQTSKKITQSINLSPYKK